MRRLGRVFEMESFHTALNKFMKGLHDTLTRCGMVCISEIGELDADKLSESKRRSFRARGWTGALVEVLDLR